MKHSISVFLPCRKGSQRIKNKNIRNFAGVDGGLTKIKLLQLIKIDEIKNIYLSTNDNEIIKIAKEINNDKIIIDKRPEFLCSSHTTTDELISYLPSLINEGHILWTHVTSPFIDESIYKQAISQYLSIIDSKDFDSLMSVTKIQKFIWNNENPINYDREKLKWPFTQNIKPLYEVNSGIFLSSLQNYKKHKDRIGLRPYLYEINPLKSFDIDWEEDFIIAEHIYNINK